MVQPHDLECRKCGLRYQNHKTDTPCPGCGEGNPLWHIKVQVPNFSPFWHPNMGHEPVYIESAKAMDQELNRRNLHCDQGRGKMKKEHLPQTYKEAQHRG